MQQSAMMHPLQLLVFVSVTMTASAEVPLYFKFADNELSTYSGFFQEHTTAIYMKPLIEVVVSNSSLSRKICGFQTYSDISPLPIEVNVTDAAKGKAKMYVRSGIKMDDLLDKYNFQLEAFDCDDPAHYSERVFVTIEKPIPEWSNQNGEYTFSVLESQPTDLFVGYINAQETVFPENEGNSLKRPVCKYEMKASEDIPFSVDNQGIIQTTKVLHHSEKTAYQFSVTAEGCTSPPRTSTANVLIVVEKNCIPGWTGLKEKVDLKSKDNAVVSLWPNMPQLASLDMCGMLCKLPTVSTTVSLDFPQEDDEEENSIILQRHLDPSLCGLLEKDLRNQRSVCGASTKTIELLPSLEEFNSNGGSVHTLTHSLQFDGISNFWRVNNDKIPKNHRLGDSFTMTFWMRHGDMNGEAKEQILCNADGEGKNRHHYALFIHNCHLIFLMRSEYNQTPSDAYTPTQWRFNGQKMSQILCNEPEKWHHFSLTMSPAYRLDLFVDGEYWQEKPDVKEDVAMQSNEDITSTVLTIGACYEGANNKMGQYLRGDLAGLTLLHHDVESPSVLRCLANCGESLRVKDLESVMQTGSSVSLTPNKIQVEGSNVSHVAVILKQIRYCNTDKYRSIQVGDAKNREISLHTSVLCTNSETEVNLTPQTLKITLQPEKKKIELSIFAASQISGKDYGHGLPLLDSVKFYEKPIENELNDFGFDTQLPNLETVVLDSCVLRVDGDLLKAGKEFILWSPSLAHQLGLMGVNNSHGLVLDGLQPASNYAQVLHSVMFHYVFESDEIGPVERSFGLACSQNNGEHVTEEKIIKMVVLNENPPARKSDEPFFVNEPKSDTDGPVIEDIGEIGDGPALAGDGVVRIKQIQPPHNEKQEKPSMAAPLIVLIIIVCCGLFFIVLIVVGIVRFFKDRSTPSYNGSSHNKSRIVGGVRPYSVYVNPLEARYGEPLVEVGYVPSHPYCPVDMTEEQGALVLENFNEEDAEADLPEDMTSDDQQSMYSDDEQYTVDRVHVSRTGYSQSGSGGHKSVAV